MNDVKIRKIKIDDTENIVKWKNNINVKKNFCIQDNLTVETHLNWFKTKVLTGEVEQFIIVDEIEKKDVGSTYLRDIDFKNKKAEFGIFIGEDTARGKGIGAKSTKLTIEYGFNELRIT